MKTSNLMTYVDFEFEAVSSSRSYPDVSGVEQGSKERIFGKKPVSDTFPFSSREEIDELVGWVYFSPISEEPKFDFRNLLNHEN